METVVCKRLVRVESEDVDDHQGDDKRLKDWVGKFLGQSQQKEAKRKEEKDRCNNLVVYDAEHSGLRLRRWNQDHSRRQHQSQRDDQQPPQTHLLNEGQRFRLLINLPQMIHAESCQDRKTKSGKEEVVGVPGKQVEFRCQIVEEPGPVKEIGHREQKEKDSSNHPYQGSAVDKA